MKRITCACSLALLIVVNPYRTEAAEKLPATIASAKPGQTITLPAGEFIGPAMLPAGVSLKGAGYGKTIIDATGLDNGIVVKGGSGAVISDLTVRGAQGANVLIQSAQKITLNRIRSTGGLIGVSLAGVKAGRIENVIADGNRYGIVLTDGEGNVVVNCTVAGNTSLGLSLASGSNNVVFNNVVTDSPTAIYVGEQATGLAVDYNLYLGFNIGKFHGQLPRNTLNNWRYLSGLDAHSLNMPVKYEDVANGRFKPASTLDWSLDRTVTGGWGASKFAGQSAPREDIDGVKRPATTALGAYEATVKPSRPADGKFTVPNGEGLTSAGVFDASGKLVDYLFQCLPMSGGEYSFWLPSRNYKGRNIEAGQYEVRVLKSKLDWQYLGWIANTETSDVPATSASVEKDSLAFDDAGRLMVGRKLSEEHMAVRGFDGATGNSLWWFNGDDAIGMTVASDGRLYVLRPNQSRVTRINPADGTIAPWGERDYGHFALKKGQTYQGLTSLGQELYYADPTNNAVQVGTLQSPEPTRTITIKAATSPSADAKANVIWVISGGEQVVALSPDGKTVAQYSDVPQPIALAARDGRLAVASSKTGKVHLFDASSPAQLKSLGTLGRGDGPDGLILPDRFLFQDGTMEARLAFGPKGELAVGELAGRLLVFDRDLKLTWSSFAIWGGGCLPSRGHPGRLFYGSFSMLVDSEKGTWNLESYHRGIAGSTCAGDFAIKGQEFMLLHIPKVGMNFVKFTPEKPKVVCGIISKDLAKGPWNFCLDDNQDGIVNDQDKVVFTFNDSQGKPVTGKSLMAGVRGNGELVSGGEGWLTTWPCAGLDDKGLPIYRYADRRSLPNAKADLISPYSHKADVYGHVALEPRDDGGLVASTVFHSSPATKAILLPGGCELTGVNKNGEVDWLHPFGRYPGTPKIGALHRADDLHIAALSASYDCFVVNADGLGMPGFSLPVKANYLGHWVDHPGNMNAFVDQYGKVNVITCDYMFGRNQWFCLRDKQEKSAKSSFTVTAEAAARLAALPEMAIAGPPEPPAQQVKIPQLKSPLTIDGDLQKWRDLGIAPLIILPEASAGIDSPHDCSALVRLAYLGTDLYVQVIRFDDILTLHQPQHRAYMGETVEMCLNGVMEGSKFNISLTSDLGPVNNVDGWYPPHGMLKQEHSPIVIKVLENAQSVPERKLIESISGQDMSDCKVQIFETKIPMDEKTFAGREKYRPPFKPGTPFYLGFLIDDNDGPGTDVQHYIAWPVTYGTFSPKETGAIAVLE